MVIFHGTPHHHFSSSHFFCINSASILQPSCTFKVTFSIRNPRPSRWEEGKCKCGVGNPDFQEITDAIRLDRHHSYFITTTRWSCSLNPLTWRSWGMVNYQDENLGPMSKMKPSTCKGTGLGNIQRPTLAGTSYARQLCHARKSISEID